MSTTPTTVNQPKLVSSCCQAQLLTVTDKTELSSYYECAKCKKPCDQAPEDTRTITEKQEDRMHDKLVWGTGFVTDSVAFVIKDMECESDYKAGKWNFIPRVINEPFKEEHSGKKFMVEVFCIDDKQVRKRLQRIVKKWNGSKKVEWKNIHEAEAISPPFQGGD